MRTLEPQCHIRNREIIGQMVSVGAGVVATCIAPSQDRPDAMLPHARKCERRDLVPVCVVGAARVTATAHCTSLHLLVGGREQGQQLTPHLLHPLLDLRTGTGRVRRELGAQAGGLGRKLLVQATQASRAPAVRDSREFC
jgi:hypothetical protein